MFQATETLVTMNAGRVAGGVGGGEGSREIRCCCWLGGGRGRMGVPAAGSQRVPPPRVMGVCPGGAGVPREELKVDTLHCFSPTPGSALFARSPTWDPDPTVP